jgi:CRISPR/Cas system-associated protein Cas5 (RAMP superfamily)
VASGTDTERAMYAIRELGNRQNLVEHIDVCRTEVQPEAASAF